MLASGTMRSREALASRPHESAGCMDFEVGTVLWDLEKVYDSPDLLRLCDYTEQMHFPKALLAL